MTDETLRIDPEQLQVAAAIQREAADEIAGALALQEQLETARVAHGPIFVNTKEAIAAAIEARGTELTDQVNTTTEFGDRIEAAGAAFSDTEARNAAHQAAVRP